MNSDQCILILHQQRILIDDRNKKQSTGNFSGYLNGKEIYQIFNGSAGMSGNESNIYVIKKMDTGKTTVVGPLNMAKKIVNASLLKMDKEKT